jgi:hypothetical protein
VKSTQRLEYARFLEALIERGLVDRETLAHVVKQCHESGALLTEILVAEGRVSDLEIARVACEIYNLAFLPIEACQPMASAREGLDWAYLRQWGLVPLHRFGHILTVAMPGFVPTEVLDALLAGEGERIVPVVGLVTSNRGWLDSNAPASGAIDALEPAVPAGGGEDGDLAAPDESSWLGLFDDADQAVQLDLKEPTE